MASISSRPTTASWSWRSTTIPTSSTASRTRSARTKYGCGCSSGLSLDKPLEQPHPYFVLADRVLDAVLEVGIVVDLHDHDAVVGLLEIDAIEAVADRLGSPHAHLDHFGRRLVEIEGAKPAFARRPVGPVLHGLPMAACHAVLAHEQRLAGQHADAPVEVGWQ